MNGEDCWINFIRKGFPARTKQGIKRERDSSG